MWFGCVDFAIAGDEEIGASAFGYKAAFVGEEGVGTFFHALSLEVGNLVVYAAAIFCFGVDVPGGYGLLGRDDKVSALFVIVGTASNVAHERDDVDGDDGTGTFCDEGVVKAQGTPGDIVHDLKVQIFQGGQIFFYGFVCGVFHLVDAEAAVDFGVFHGGVQAFQVVAKAVGFLLEGAGHFKYHVSKHQGGVEDGDTGFAFGNEGSVEIDEALGHGEAFRESRRLGNGLLYIRQFLRSSSCLEGGWR